MCYFMMMSVTETIPGGDTLMSTEFWWNDTDVETQSTQRKICSSALCPLQIPHGLALD